MAKVLFFLLLFSSFSGICQKEDNIWVSGGSIVFTSEFKSDTVINSLYIDSSMGWGIYSAHGNTCICDKNGKLLCSSDGMNVYHRNHHLMEGGYKLVPELIYKDKYGWSGWSQSSILLPCNNKIYLFTATASDERFKIWNEGTVWDSACFDMLTYHEIDMDANNGLGKVVKSKIPLIENDFLMPTEMMACRHANGRDWWLLKGINNTIAYYTFLINENGIHYYGRQDFIRYAQDTDADFDGQCTFSPDGTMFATVIGHRGTINLFDFDRCTGKLSNQRYYNVPHLTSGNPNDSTELELFTTEGISFSPNQKYLYVSGDYTIQQFEYQNQDSALAWYLVSKMDTTYNAFSLYSNLYLGPNSRIYIGNWGGLGGEMSVINNPNGKGADCGWCRKCMRFPLYYGATTPPCMPNYRLGALTGSACDTIGKIYSDEVVVFPNPSNDQILVSLPLNMNTGFQYQVLDMLGNKVLEEKSVLNSKSQFTVDVTELATGMYILRINSSPTVFVAKFVKR